MTNTLYAEDRSADFQAYQKTAYEAVLYSVGQDRAQALIRDADQLAESIRQAGDRNPDASIPGRIGDTWLVSNTGGIDDQSRRAMVAALARILEPDERLLPQSILELYPSVHVRLARFLSGSHRYTDDLFSKDLAMVSGLAAPMGPLTIFVPSREAPRLTTVQAKRAAGGFQRHLRQHSLGEACEWLGQWGVKPWVELHVDTRNLAEFNPPGFDRGYHRLADLMKRRPDLAGIYGASWIYQPELSEISPNLAFCRESAEAAGGRLVRLKPDPAQTAFALARAPVRRRLYMTGEYKPVSYGMFWTRDAVIDWSDRERQGTLN